MTDRQIPKVIHYCWFGKSEKPPIVRDCIDSWNHGRKHVRSGKSLNGKIPELKDFCVNLNDKTG